MPPSKPTPLRRSWLQFSLRTLCLFTLLCAVGIWGTLRYDFYMKLRHAETLIADYLTLDHAKNEFMTFPAKSQARAMDDRSNNYALESLKLGAVHLPQPRQRMACVKGLVEKLYPKSLPAIEQIERESRDNEVRAAAIHLLGLTQDVKYASRLEQLLDDKSVDVRVAALDALGTIRRPDFQLEDRFDAPVLFQSKVRRLDTDPKILVHPFKANWTERDSVLRGIVAENQHLTFSELRDGDITELPETTRLKAESLMLTSASSRERDAAARMLVSWPPTNYQLRVAEWGVWIDDQGELKLVQSVLDEIPPFVHRTMNPVGSFTERINPIMVITKPIVHVTVNRPLAIDMQVLMHDGRPWFGFPRPNDFSLEVNNVGYVRLDRSNRTRQPLPLEEFDQVQHTNLQQADFRLENLYMGHDWLLPKFRSTGPISSGMGAGSNQVTGMGLRWSSLVVCNDQPDWAQPPDVGSDPKFQWWSELRKVPSSWIGQMGEAERFLYYDGPTRKPPPIRISPVEQGIRVDANTIIDFNRLRERLPADLTFIERLTQSRSCFLIDVEPSRTRWQLIDVSPFDMDGYSRMTAILGRNVVQAKIKELQSEMSRYLSFDDTAYQNSDPERRFHSLLVERGLTVKEADGLVAVWRKQFFETPGLRLLTIMSEEDYAAYSELKVRPQPTSLVRVGIVLRELGAVAK
ncbi:MAG: HEAT repeat domain-containing protein [Pirellulaceae bacterium]|nr:HEAT repeat domain-containing protein [Pirellulaceae bacterium]